MLNYIKFNELKIRGLGMLLLAFCKAFLEKFVHLGMHFIGSTQDS